MPEANKPLYNAFSSVLSYPIASPVDFISGPKDVSTLLNLSKREDWKFDVNILFLSGRISVLNPCLRSDLPGMHRVAMLAIGMPVILLKNGTVRLARGIHFQDVYFSVRR